jgi:glyoxalase superfamily protein
MTMAPQLQIVLDCADPHAQAAFWAEVFGYDVERNGEFVQKMLDEGMATDADVTTIDGVLAWAEGSAIADPGGKRPRWFFQKVPESKTVKNRMHVDVQVGTDRVATEVARLEQLGATRLYDGRKGPHPWVTMADPEGNEFCVS